MMMIEYVCLLVTVAEPKWLSAESAMMGGHATYVGIVQYIQKLIINADDDVAEKQ
jgi:hypothetical protein